jgi:hypothetical protein
MIRKNLPLHCPPFIMKKTAQQYLWKEISEGMKNLPIICQAYVPAAHIPFYKKWPQIKCFHYMDDLLIAHPSFTLLNRP